MYKNRNAVFGGFNSADGTTTDNTIDAVISRDPNNYLVPKINGFTTMNTLFMIVAILGIVILLPIAVKNIKQLF